MGRVKEFEPRMDNGTQKNKIHIQPTHIAMAAPTNRHGNLIPDAQPVVHLLGRRIHNDRRALRVGELVPGPLVHHQRPRRDRRGDRVRVVRQALGVAHERAQRRVGPPPRAALAVLQRLVLPAQAVVAVGAEPLHAAAHGHGEGYAGVEQAGGERGFAEPRAPRHADAGGVDLGHRGVERVEDAVEAPGPGCEGACCCVGLAWLAALYIALGK